METVLPGKYDEYVWMFRCKMRVYAHSRIESRAALRNIAGATLLLNAHSRIESQAGLTLYF